MPNIPGKLICGATARKYLNCSKGKFESLVVQGEIQAFRDEDRRWQVSKESVLNYIERTRPTTSKTVTNIGTRIITNQNHYTEVIQRICDAKSSIKIMTGDFQYFSLKMTTGQEKRRLKGAPFIKFLMDKAEKGVSVQIILSDPTQNVSDELIAFFRETNSNCFSTRNCIRNHAKVVIIDDEIAYMGSANATRAGLGQHKPGNFEVGILTEDSSIIASMEELFSKIWEGDFCENCHRKNFCPEY